MIFFLGIAIQNQISGTTTKDHRKVENRREAISLERQGKHRNSTFNPHFFSA